MIETKTGDEEGIYDGHYTLTVYDDGVGRRRQGMEANGKIDCGGSRERKGGEKGEKGKGKGEKGGEADGTARGAEKTRKAAHCPRRATTACRLRPLP